MICMFVTQLQWCIVSEVWLKIGLLFFCVKITVHHGLLKISISYHFFSLLFYLNTSGTEKKHILWVSTNHHLKFERFWGTQNVLEQVRKVSGVIGVCSWRDRPATTSCPDSTHCCPHSSSGHAAPQVSTPLLHRNPLWELRASHERHSEPDSVQNKQSSLV